MTRQFVVVGGGLAGLTAAIAMATKGHQVVLCEQSSHVGGRAATQEESGFSFNLGPHALYVDGVAYSTFRRWNIKFSGKSPRVRDSAYLLAAGRKHLFPSTPWLMLLTQALRAKEKFEAIRLLKRLLKMNSVAPEGTLQEWLSGNCQSHGASQFIRALVRLSTYCDEPELLSASAAIRQMQMAFTKGVMYLDGGWGTLVNGLVQKASSVGIQLRTDAKVQSVEPGMVQFTDGRKMPAAGMVLAVGPETVERLTGKKMPHLVKTRMACLDLGLRRAPQRAAKFALGLDEPFYLSMHSIWASLAPEGGTLVHVGKYLNSRGTGTRDELERYADLFLPGWRRETEVVRFLPNMVVSNAVMTPAGRPDIDILALDRMAIAGEWIGPEGMLADAAVSSALRAADRLVAYGAPVLSHVRQTDVASQSSFV